MRSLFLGLFAILFSIAAFAQTRQERYSNRLKKELKPENRIAGYDQYDFSTLIVPKGEFIGYIGTDYERIRISYISVVRDEKNKNQYLIKGISVVRNNKCDFSGTARITGVYERKTLQYGVDSMYKDAGFQAQGIMVAEYTFKEDPSQNHPGTFKGTMSVNWLIDKDSVLRKNHIYNYSDTFRDNQHVGTWTAYTSKKPKPCNWGVARIPFSKGLDIGAGEFSPDPKYNERGWDDYKDLP